MIQFHKKVSRLNRDGFTLIEIIVSIVVIGTLLSISIVSYGNWKQRATITQAKSDLSQIASAFENYRTSNNSYPNDITKIANFKVSSGITLTGGSANGNYFCINATATDDSSVKYYISSTKKEVQSGSCPAHSWKMVNPGNGFYCGISSDDKAYCWGAGSNGRLGNGSSNSSLTPIAISKGSMASLNVKSISVGGFHACVIGFDDKAYCWGDNYYGQLGNNSTANSFSPVAVSKGAMASLNVKSISAGGNHTCAIGFDDKAYCWGSNGTGTLGDNSTTQRLIPVAVSQGSMDSLNVKSISAKSSNHTCAIGFNDQAYCWGGNSNGQLGNNSTVSSSIPVAISQGTMSSLNIKSISTASSISNFTCAIGFDDKAYCWGNSDLGQLGNGSSTQRLIPTAVSQGAMASLSVKSISTGSNHACVVGFDDKAYCWGYNSVGQLGDNTTNSGWSPKLVYQIKPTSAKIISILAGSSNTTILDSAGDSYSFGANFDGELGLGYMDYIKKPTPISQGEMTTLGVKKISSSNNYSCAIGFDDKAYCWGYNGDAQLGNNSSKTNPTPATVYKGNMASLSVKSISTGDTHACVIGFNDNAYCWGYSYNGEVGNGSTSTRYSPTVVWQGAMASLNVKYVSAAGYWHTCAIGFDDKVYCWGGNSSGQLGNNSTTKSLTPVAMSQGDMTTLNVKMISLGNSHTCAIGFDDKAYCWGYNGYGQLGNNSTTSSSIPILVSQGAMASLNVKSISAGENHTCVIGFDDKAYCWGNNSYGQLGNNSGTQSLIPVVVSQGDMASLNIKEISTGEGFTCAIGFNSITYCWGQNNYGQLGNNSLTISRTPSATEKNEQTKSLSITTGSHTCYIDFKNQGYCRGVNSYGGLGVPENSIFSHNTPQLALPPQ